MQPTRQQIGKFKETVWRHYRDNGRVLPWREDVSPYSALVSELMLQQTQVNRVIPKYTTFLYTCPNIAVLAGKSLSEVLALWSGLGYNRRAKFLHQTAQAVLRDYGGVLPNTKEELVKLPGIGKNTAGAIMAYAYNQPVAFVETNIRSVYFHHFFPAPNELVTDKQLETLVEQTLDRIHPREWYWALMDYGTYLKQTAGGRLDSSKHYVKQAPLKGSLREMRGRIVKCLVSGRMPEAQLYEAVEGDERFGLALQSLRKEGLVVLQDGTVGLTGDQETS